MIDMLLNASVSGGIVILLWGLSYPLSRKYFKASWHYAVLKITMLFMVFPVSIFASAFNGMFGELFAKHELPRIYKIPEQIQMVSINAETIDSVNSALSEFVFPAVQYSPTTIQTDNPNAGESPDNINIVDDVVTNNGASIDIPYLQIIWFVVGIVLFGVEIKKRHKFKRQVLSSSNSSINHETLELFLQCKKELKVRGRVTLRTSEYIKTPLAFGLIRPFVVFPETEMDGDEKRIALIHELTHIKNGDLWLKLFASVISAVHWFNPLSHMLRRKIAVVSEDYCDERIVKAMTKEERFIYGNLILKVVSDIAIPPSTVCSTLSASTKNLKRRLFNMMNIKKSRKSMIAISVIAALILCSFATIYAFAANPAITITVDNIDSEELYKEIHDELAKVEKNLKDKFKDSDVTINLSDSVDSIVTEEMLKQLYEAHPDAKEILERVQKYLYSTKDTISREDLIQAVEKYREFIEKLKEEWINYQESLKETEPNENSMTYDEFKEFIETIVKSELKGLLGKEYTQEEIDKKIAQYEFILEGLRLGRINVWKCYPESINGWYFYIGLDTYIYKIKSNGKDNIGFGGNTYEQLYRVASDYLEREIKMGRINLEEAKNQLTEMSIEITTKFFDGNWKILKNPPHIK